MTRLLQLLRSVAKRRATAKPLLQLMKSSAVALLQRFRRVLAGNFNSRRPNYEPRIQGADKFSGAHTLATGKVSAKALILLASPVVPETASTEAIEHLGKGEVVTAVEARERLDFSSRQMPAPTGRPAVELKIPGTTSGKQRNSATADDFINIINCLSVALYFATERNSRNREFG